MVYNLTLVLVSGILALAFSFWKRKWISSQSEGNEKMKAIGASIAAGAMAFLKAEYRVLSIFVFFVAIILGFANYNNDDSLIQAAVSEAELSLSHYLNKNESAIGMGTTLALLYFNNKEAVAAHVGDSRIYHIRNKEIIWKSSDHSLVNEMVINGIITDSKKSLDFI